MRDLAERQIMNKNMQEVHDMKQMRKRIVEHGVKMALRAVALALLVLCGLSVAPDHAAAAVKEVKLNNRTDITKYDITGDGRKDKLRIDSKEVSETSEDEGINWYITVNGKVVYKAKDKYTNKMEVSLYQIGTKCIYLEIHEVDAEASFNLFHGLYQYSGGKLKCVCDFYTPMVKKIWDYRYETEIISLTSKKMTVVGGNEFGGTGWLHWKMVYQNKDGKWKLKGNTYTVVGSQATNNKQNKLTAKKEIKMYKKPGGKSVSFTVKSGEKVKIKKICIKGKKTYIQAVNLKGKAGW